MHLKNALSFLNVNESALSSAPSRLGLGVVNISIRGRKHGILLFDSVVLILPKSVKFIDDSRKLGVVCSRFLLRVCKLRCKHRRLLNLKLQDFGNGRLGNRDWKYMFSLEVPPIITRF